MPDKIEQPDQTPERVKGTAEVINDRVETEQLQLRDAMRTMRENNPSLMVRSPEQIMALVVEEINKLGIFRQSISEVRKLCNETPDLNETQANERFENYIRSIVATVAREFKENSPL